MIVALVICSKVGNRWWLVGYFHYPQAVIYANRFMRVGHLVEFHPVNGHEKEMTKQWYDSNSPKV